MKFRFLNTALILLFSIALFGQDADKVMTDIKSAIKTMNASTLASHFDDRIDLEIGTADGNYSSKQAEVIVRDFFKKEPVQSFSINHQGSSNDGSKYMIGTYINSSNKEYRVYILIKNAGEKFKITQLQFEED